ncbi:response regulator [Paenibacillaceae bacterium WGS1546]|uniref:response regulator transcription factor n=1 Tax=Cohnella sp. WGS1546 TaxID=3366810 RepID=UPI00372D6B07
MKILIVDDEPVIRKGVIKLLGAGPVAFSEIEEARSGEEALRLIESGKPDLVITDIRMSAMSGLDLIERFRAVDAGIEVIVLTGYADFHYVQRALRNQVSDYLLKPITQKNLNEVLAKTMLKDPAKWPSQIDLDGIRAMTGTAGALVKSVLAEDREEIRAKLAQWFAFCKDKGYSFTEMKRVMAHLELLFRSELVLIVKDQPGGGPADLQRNAASVDELFDKWERYLVGQSALIADKRSPRNKRVVDDAIRFIGEEYGNSGLNLQLIADRASVSAAYMSKIFREVMGKPITQYISEFRLEAARQVLIRQPEAKIAAVAEACGFSDYPYFSKIFKKAYGVSPLEYKEKN